jgi:hypothetical protein
MSHYLKALPWAVLTFGSFFGVGLAGLLWYQSLSREEQKQADEAAGQLALEMFNKQYSLLARHEANQVHAILEKRFAS